jgi:4,5-DOPA dioxygenase extradiol
MAKFPALFVSHGPPSMALEPVPCRYFLRRLGARLGRPEAILCVSAHWETARPRVGASHAPPTIHDFHGFHETLYRLRYPAPGAPELARRAAALLAANGMDCDSDADRGLDHGAWIPLMLMRPKADTPVTQLSIQPGGDGAHHLALGRALAPLRDEDVLIVASGNATHNLGERGERDDPPAAWAQAFDDWLTAAVEAGRADDLADYLETAPEAERNHPTPDHYMPLLVALGAGGPGARGRRLHASFMYATLSMAAFSFA